MSTHRHIDRICAAAMALALVILALFVNGQALGLRPASRSLGYETWLFDDSRVHTLDIVMDDWEGFLAGCEDEEYSSCTVVIDNEAFSHVGIRAKGNTSLSMVSAMNSSRYSFKIEFDHYQSGASCRGLDKLCLNNLIQDNTCMKDYLVYRMMAEMGAAAPLCSFVYVTVNGRDWGLYLAVEAMEDSFLQRNYGRDHGELYKPDSMDLGGGRGNGRDFHMEDLDLGGLEGDPTGSAPPAAGPEEGGAPPALPGEPSEGMGGTTPGERPLSGGLRERGGFPGGGMDAEDVRLRYIDDDPDSYGNIFSNAKTDVSAGDQARLIEALRLLGEGEAEAALDVDQVLRYFVVHNYAVNGDSYTGSIVHNYYLYEEDGLLSMLPWDYNLAFGGFQGRDASAAVNDPIDAPLSITGSGDRPMADWIFQSQEYTERYHQVFREFLDTVDPETIISQAQALITPYVERDPTKFCTMEEFTAGVEALRTFCALRTESVSRQLEGTLSSTAQGREDSAALVDVSGLELSDMGAMEAGGPGRGVFRGEAGESPAFPEGPGERGRGSPFPAGGAPPG